MHIKTIVSAGALAIALGFAGGATAQTMIGAQTLGEGDAERVKVYCEDLQNRENAADPGTDPDDPTAPAEDTTGDEAAPDTETDTEDDEGMVGTINLEEITLQQCIDGGFVTE